MATLLAVGAFFSALFFGLPHEAFAPGEIPPEAERSTQRGLAAAKIEDWEVAIKYFKEAYESGAQLWGPARLNLALAYDKAGGRELLAIAWYRAFLPLAHDVQDKRLEQVKQRIVELDVQAESVVRRMIKVAEEGVLKLPNTNREEHMSIAKAQAALGDFPAALESLRQALASIKLNIREQELTVKIRWDINGFAGAVMSVAVSQWKHGDLGGARETLDWGVRNGTVKIHETGHERNLLRDWGMSQVQNIEVLREFIKGDWAASWKGGGVLYSSSLAQKISQGKMDSLFRQDSSKWNELVRAAIKFYDYESFYELGIMDESCWWWRGIPAEIWTNVARCGLLREFEQDWRVSVKEKTQQERPVRMMRDITRYATDMAEVLYLFRKLNAFHKDNYWGDYY